MSSREATLKQLLTPLDASPRSYDRPRRRPRRPLGLPPGVFSGCTPTQGQTEVIRPHRPDASWIALDIIGAINFATGVVSIDEHDMWVYAVDGGYVEPQKVQALVLTNGDRYSVMVRLQNKGNYKIRFNSVSAPQMIVGHAVLSVGGYSVEQVVDSPYVGITGTPLSPNVVFFNESKAAPYPPTHPLPQPTPSTCCT